MIRDEDAPSDANMKCAVCLQIFDDKVVLSSCFHAFCRFCILQWAEFEPARRYGLNRCPLCRTSFSTLISNFSDENHTYDVYHMDEDVTVMHWSQQDDNEDAIRLLNIKSKQEAVLRQRRLSVYNLGLIPVIDFKIPVVSSDIFRRKIITSKILSSFQSKGRSFLETEIPILLLHSNMKASLSTLKTQEQEVDLLIDLIKALLEDALPFLIRLVAQRIVTAKIPDLIKSMESEGMDLLPFNALHDAISPFFGEFTSSLLCELTYTLLSPYSLEHMETHLKYLEPQEEPTNIENGI